MTEQLRRLTQSGIKHFDDYLADLRNNNSLAVPYHLLNSGEMSEAFVGAPDIDRPGFKTKRDAAEYLNALLSPLDKGNLSRDAGLWTWLALFYFDDLCPKSPSGSRKPNADPHYILDAYNFKRTYRHLLATPYRILRALPKYNRIFLDSPIHIHGDLTEQMMGRLYLIRKPAVSELIDNLYFDETRARPKRGILNHGVNQRRGDLRNRLPVRIIQLEKNYDVDSLNGGQLLSLLGEEFEGWLAK